MQLSLNRIQPPSRLRKVLNRAGWIEKRSGVCDIAAQTESWRIRLEVWLQGLSPQIRAVTYAIDDGNRDTNPPPVAKSHSRLQEFLTLVKPSKETHARKMLLENNEEVVDQIKATGDISYLPVQLGAKQVIFSSRNVSPKVVSGSQQFKKMLLDIGELAAALNCLDQAAGIRILKVDHYFYNEISRQFLFAPCLPYPILSMMTLQKMIGNVPFPEVEAALGGRLKLAHKLTEAVYFLHTAGFLHKNITSQSVVAFRKAGTPLEKLPSFFLDDTYLMGFNLVRRTEAQTLGEDAVPSDKEPQQSMWDFEVTNTPTGSKERMFRGISVRMTCTAWG